MSADPPPDAPGIPIQSPYEAVPMTWNHCSIYWPDPIQNADRRGDPGWLTRKRAASLTAKCIAAIISLYFDMRM